MLSRQYRRSWLQKSTCGPPPMPAWQTRAGPRARRQSRGPVQVHYKASASIHHPLTSRSAPHSQPLPNKSWLSLSLTSEHNGQHIRKVCMQLWLFRAAQHHHRLGSTTPMCLKCDWLTNLSADVYLNFTSVGLLGALHVHGPPSLMMLTHGCWIRSWLGATTNRTMS